MIPLSTPIEAVQKIDKRIIPALKRLGIKTARDLLFHFPARYEDFSNEKTIREVATGETVTIRGTIQKITNRRTTKKKMMLTEAVIRDESGILKALWFNQPYLLRNLRTGDTVNFSGKIAKGPSGIYLQNPAYEKVESQKLKVKSMRGVHTGGLVAIYPETSGITSRWLRYLIKSFIETRRGITDPLPDETRRRCRLQEIKDALFAIHFPRTREEATHATRRFNFEELLLIQLSALRSRMALKKEHAPAIPLNLPLIKEFVKTLPFTLTDAQRRSLWEIIQDLAKPSPMNRLLEGDVGSGKTVVAAGAILVIIKGGWRALCMAPTEILARQHHDTFARLLASFGIRVGLLLGSEKNADARHDLVVGTHALIQKGVRFEKLGLIVIDEQHRFGVAQRQQLLRNNPSAETIPHFLSMSATPIPRTLALTIYGDLDLSLLDEMPKIRKPVITAIVEPVKRHETYQFIREEVMRGRQVFVICPRIESTKNRGPEEMFSPQRLLRAETKAVKDEHKKLAEEIFPELRVAILHGKMKSEEKKHTMEKFKDRAYDILVSTSVIEVGVDIANATIMMIEGAEHFGLAQLHQFRGRVGRGAEQSYCFLFPSEDGIASRRLRAVVEARNGFELAQKDLDLRGPGEFFGIRQSGIPTKIFAALGDARLLREVRREAAELLQKSPDLARYPALKSRMETMEKETHPE